MRALSLMLVVGLLLAAVGTGCASKREEVPQIEPGDLQPTPVATVASPTPMPSKGTPAVVVETPGPGRLAAPAKADSPAKIAADGSQTYTVQKGDTLYSLARTFYGDIALRTKILDANKAKIKDPNVLPVGAVLTIPPK